MIQGPQLIIVLAIVLLLFGGSKLPKLARSLGQAQKEFRDGLKEGQDDEAQSAPSANASTATPPQAIQPPGAQPVVPPPVEQPPVAETPAPASTPGDDDTNRPDA
jgi:sec-independent protein translocase protein TatA